MSTCGFLALTDLLGDLLNFVLDLEGRLGTVDELFDHLRVDVASGLLGNVDREGRCLLVDQVFMLADQPQDTDDLGLRQAPDAALFD